MVSCSAFPKPEPKAGATGTVTKVDAVPEAKTQVEGYSTSEGGVSLTDAGVIGDMHKIVPALTEAFKKKLGK